MIFKIIRVDIDCEYKYDNNFQLHTYADRCAINITSNISFHYHKHKKKAKNEKTKENYTIKCQNQSKQSGKVIGSNLYEL